MPIFPDRYDFEVATDKKKQFKIVAELLKQANTIIVATDSDREGENIAWSIIHKANAFSKDKTYKRLWINSLEKDVIRSGFQNLQPGMNYYPFYQEAQTRQIADWLIGMNASPLYTLNLQQKGVQGTFSLGRVQTPTLYLIFQRQEAIENFRKEPFFEVEASIKVNQGSFKGVISPTQRFKTQEELLAFVSSEQAKIGNQEGIIADVQTKEKKTNSPSLFSLSSLQSKVNQLYKATASQTLKAMQGLYEAKLLSYPRTDTPFITENEFAYLKANFGKYSGFLGLDLEMVQTEPRKRYVDGSKVQEHHAIIPTKQVPTESALAKMDDLQRKIYALVVKTTVAMFLPDYLYEETKIQTKVADLLFQSIGKTPKQEGWKILFTIIDKSTKRIGTVGINPSDFPFNFYLFICCPDDRYQCVHHLPLVLKADILPVIQIPGNAFHLLHRHSVRREFCNLIGNGLPPCVQLLNFAVGIGEQNRACARQRVKQLFNLAFYLCQFQPLCSQFRGDFCSLVPTCQRLKIFQLFNHRPIDYRFQFVQLHAPAAGTRLAVRMDGAAQVKNTVGVRRHERIAAFPAFDFSRHPCVPGFPCGLVSVAGKQLLPAFQPQLRWDKPLMWSQYQRLSLQVLVLVLCIPLALIVIAAVCPGKVGGIIVNIRSLAFVKLVYVEVSHDINRVAENNAQSSP